MTNWGFKNTLEVVVRNPHPSTHLARCSCYDVCVHECKRQLGGDVQRHRRLHDRPGREHHLREPCRPRLYTCGVHPGALEPRRPRTCGPVLTLYVYGGRTLRLSVHAKTATPFGVDEVRLEERVIKSKSDNSYESYCDFSVCVACRAAV